jgi:3-phenylpropionate/trans-cinnamate dioxygenase ferredoxin subunit
MTRVCAAAEVPEGTSKRVVVDGVEIAIVNAGGVFYAVSDICSHEYFHLSDGEVDVDDLTIECPKHGSTFHLQTGRPNSLPAILPIKTYGVRVVGDDVMVEVLAPAREAAG